jgi:hypothetical protein
MASKVMSRTFQKAAELVGGQKNLARRLRVPLAELQKWIAGGGSPPMAIFLKAVDVVLDETHSPAAGSEPDDPPPPRDCAATDGTSYYV